MNYRLEPCDLYRETQTVNAMKETVTAWSKVGTIRAAISAATGGTVQRVNDLMRVESTHTAVTWDAVQIGDRLRRTEEDTGSGTGFQVLYIIPGGRRKLNQLFLKRTDDVPDREAIP